MPSWIIGLIQVGVGAAITFLVQHLSSRELRWKLVEERKSDYARRREPLYAKALEFIYAIEGNQGKADALEKEFREFAEWLPANTLYFPPYAKEKLFTLRTYTLLHFVDLSNRDRDNDTVRLFRDSLRDAKEYFLNSKDIAWLPEDLSLSRGKKKERG